MLQLLPHAPTSLRRASVAMGGMRAGMAAPGATAAWSLPGSPGIRPTSARRRRHARIALGGVGVGAPPDTTAPVILPGIRPTSARRRRHARIALGGVGVGAPPDVATSVILPGSPGIRPTSARRGRHALILLGGLRIAAPPSSPVTPPRPSRATVPTPRRYRTGATATGTGPVPSPPLPPPRPARAAVPTPRRHRTGAISTGTGPVLPPLAPPRPARVAVPTPRRHRNGAISTGTGPTPPPLAPPRLARATVPTPRRYRTGAISTGTGLAPSPSPPRPARAAVPPSRRHRTGTIATGTGTGPVPSPSPAQSARVAVPPPRRRRTGTIATGTGLVLPPPPPPPPVLARTYLPSLEMSRRARYPGQIVLGGMLVAAPPLPPPPPPPSDLPAIPTIVLAASRARPRGHILIPSRPAPAPVPPAAGISVAAASRRPRGATTARFGTRAASRPALPVATMMPIPPAAMPRRRPAGVITFAVRIPPAPAPMPMAGLPARALVVAAHRRRSLVAATGIVAPLGTRPALAARPAVAPPAPHRARTTAARRDGRIGPIVAMGGTIAAAVAMGTLARPTLDVRLAPPRRRGPHPVATGTRTPASPCPARAARPFREHVAAPRLRRHSAPILHVAWPMAVAGTALPSYAPKAKVDPANRRRHHRRFAIVLGGTRVARPIAPPAPLVVAATPDLRTRRHATIVLGGTRVARPIAPPAPLVVAATPDLRTRRHATIALGGTRMAPLPVPVVVPSLVPAAPVMVPDAARKRLRHAAAVRTSRVWPDVLVPMAPDLLAAVVHRLRATPAVVAALGEDTSSPRSTKIWADDLAQGQPDLPYLTYSELSEDLSPESADYAGIVHYFGHGKLTLSLLDRGKLSARQTARLVVEALNDAMLVFDDGLLLELRHSNPAAPTVADVGPGTPSVYKRTLDFEYVVQRQF